MTAAGSVAGYAPLLAAMAPTGSGLAAIPRSETEALRMVAKEFESIFIGELMKSMRNATFESGLFGQDRASKMYREMHDQALAHEMAMSGRFGIADMIYAELSRSVAKGI